MNTPKLADCSRKVRLQLQILCKLAVVPVAFAMALAVEARAQIVSTIPKDFGWRKSIPLHLIGEKKVAADLGLSADVVKSLQKLQKQIDAEMDETYKQSEANLLANLEGGPYRSRKEISARNRRLLDEMREEILHKTRKDHLDELNKLLTPEQQTRLYQIQIQSHPDPDAVLSDSGIAKELGLTDKQQGEIKAVWLEIQAAEINALKSGTIDLPGPAEYQILEHARPEKIMKILTEEQRVAFDKLKGTPLKSNVK